MTAMRKYIYYLSLALAAVFALASCAKEEDKALQQREIKFSASLGTFQVKATDTAFEKGDAVGVYALGTTTFSNRKLVYDGVNLTAETPVYWSSYQQVNEGNLFRAYYPYQEGLENEKEYFFTVQPDQSTHASYTASDLMVGDAYASPSDGTVHLNFVHQMSKVVLTIDNRLGSEIADVYFADVYGRVRVYPGEGLGAIGEPGTIKAGKVTLTDGSPAWALILAPQGCNPRLLITTVDGKQYTYYSDYTVYFSSGHRYGVRIVLDETSISTDFTSDVLDWVDDSDIQFGQMTPQPQNGSWAVIGSIMGTGWDTDFWMERCYSEYNCYYGLIYYQEGDEFKLRCNGDWSINVGVDDYTGTGGHIAVPNGPNIQLGETGLYELFFYADENYLYIAPAGTEKTWGVIGTIEGTGWDTDFPMTFAHNGDAPCFFTNITYHAGESFKLRFQGNWYLNYGLANWNWGDAIPSGKWFLMERDGADILLEEGDGSYQVIFDWNLRAVSIYRFGDISQEIVANNVGEVLNGPDNNVYTVTGGITQIANTSYGNYYIADETGELYIYGTVTGEGMYPKALDGGWYSPVFGLVPGDVVTVKGPKTTYNGVAELVDVQLLDVQRVPLGALYNQISVSPAQDVVSFEIRSTQGEPSFSSDADWISISTEEFAENWYRVIVSVNENSSTGERAATLIAESAGSILNLYIYQLGATVPGEAGSLENPFDIASAIAFIENGGTGEVYVKGIVTRILYTFSADYGTGTFWISDNGECYGVADDNKSTTAPDKDFECYSVYWLGNRNWADGDRQIEIGDEVIVCGQLTKYKNTYETAGKKAYVYSVNGKTQ